MLLLIRDHHMNFKPEQRFESDFLPFVRICHTVAYLKGSKGDKCPLCQARGAAMPHHPSCQICLELKGGKVWLSWQGKRIKTRQSVSGVESSGLGRPRTQLRYLW